MTTSQSKNKLIKPNWDYEIKHSQELSVGLGRPCLNICGVDEAGRGPLAGPVVAAAVIFPQTGTEFFAPDLKLGLENLDDSKRLSEQKREELFQYITSIAKFGIGISEPEEIDRINILQASMIAMRRAINNLPVRADLALIDGNKIPHINTHCVPIVKGDQKSLSIAAASIIAKVIRDRIMTEAHTRFPQYGLDGHKGYPTKSHREAIEFNKPCPIHRFSFGSVKMIKNNMK